MPMGRCRPPQPATTTVTVSHTVVLYCCIAFALTTSRAASCMPVYAVPPLVVLATERPSSPPQAAPICVLFIAGTLLLTDNSPTSPYVIFGLGLLTAPLEMPVRRAPQAKAAAPLK